MKISRRAIVLGAVAAPLVAPSRKGAAWPSGIIRIVVPFPPGGTTDRHQRHGPEPGLQKRLGATIDRRKRAGRIRQRRHRLVVKSPQDGNTWLFVFDTHAVNPFLFSLPFDTAKDLDPVLLIGTAPNVTRHASVANRSRRWRT